jgi:hypothetical protein
MLPTELWYLASNGLSHEPLASDPQTRPARTARPAYNPRRALALGFIRLGRLIGGRRRRSALTYATADR